jgi:hypothetical protein
MNAQPVRHLHAGPAEYLWLSTSLPPISRAVALGSSAVTRAVLLRRDHRPSVPLLPD